jgi:hypothetical protein
MFIDFFYRLKKEIPVTTTEFIDLLKVILELHQKKEIFTLEKIFILFRVLP